MRVALRKAGIAFTVLLTTTLMAVGTATSAYAGKALMVAGLTTSTMHDLVMQQILGGRYINDERVSVEWPAQAKPYTGKNDLTLGQSIAVGLDNLEINLNAALASDEPVTVVGLSAGALVVDELLRKLATDPNAPDKSKLTFVMVADSSRQNVISGTKYNSSLDYTYQTAAQTKYDVIVVTGEYDGNADFPDRWWNLLAVANAMAGSLFVHIPMMFTNLDTVPAENITTTVNDLGGVTTHYLVPTAKLPLVQLMPFLAPFEASLKAAVDRGYSRNDPPSSSARVANLTVTAPASAAGATASVTVEEQPAAEPAPVAEAKAEADAVTETATAAEAVQQAEPVAVASADPAAAVAEPAEEQTETAVAEAPKPTATLESRKVARKGSGSAAAAAASAHATRAPQSSHPGNSKPQVNSGDKKQRADRAGKTAGAAAGAAGKHAKAGSDHNDD